MDYILVFKVDGVEHEIELDATHAPKTLAKVAAALPATIDVHCAKIAGSHIMWPVPFVERVEKASDVLAMPPGAFFFWPERQYLEITYDALQDEAAAVSYLGRLTGDVTWLREYADNQRRNQGRSLFAAELFIRNAGPSSATAAPSGSSAWDRLRAARQQAWRQQPADVQALLDRRGLNIPFGPLAMAEGELRKLHELLWRLWNEGDQRGAKEKIAIAVFAVEAAITRVGGFCHMLATATVLRDGIVCLEKADAPLQEVLVELVLYVGRMAAWLDLHICWWPMNELTLDVLDNRQSTLERV
jgi:hypothetical protein